MFHAGLTSEFITLPTKLLDLKVNYHYKQPGSKTIKKGKPSLLLRLQLCIKET